MHDLNTIHKLNNEAILRQVPQALAAGKSAILKWDGVHFMGASFHNSLDEAESTLRKLSHQAPISVRYEIRHGTQSH